MTAVTNLGTYALYIYFPATYERKGEPYILYVQKDWGDRLQGGPDPEELARGRFAHFPASRCQPYSQELWAACEEWIRAYRAVQQSFKELARGRYARRFQRKEQSNRER